MARPLGLALISLIALTNAMLVLDALPQHAISQIKTMHVHIRSNTGELISLDIPKDGAWHSVNSEAVTCFRECTDLILHEGTLAKHSIGSCRLATDFIGKTFDLTNNGTGPLVPLRTDPPYHILHVCCGDECAHKQPMGWPALEPVVESEKMEIK